MCSLKLIYNITVYRGIVNVEENCAFISSQCGYILLQHGHKCILSHLKEDCNLRVNVLINTEKYQKNCLST